ncbi:MAG: hypothetical protein K8R88_10590 [Armatimonadetes bacterium]|nr:hypothetical protein [Armatimonadota bacterium]
MLDRRLLPSRQKGQTLIIAILVLGVLLILGFVFAALVSRNITNSSRSSRRTLAGDLAESGIRYAHYQLQNSTLGADWRPDGSVFNIDGLGNSRDPDALYLRPGSGRPYRTDLDTLVDQGGPDGLGPFSRIDSEKGRSLIRVRYAPADFGSLASGSGALRQPGKARAFIILESVGRAGKVNSNDPSTLLAQAVQVSLFTSNAQFRDSLGKMKALDSTNGLSRKLIAFAQVGLFDYSHFISNKFNVSRPAEIGSLTRTLGGAGEGIGASYNEGAGPVDVRLTTLFGSQIADSSGNVVLQGTGGLRCNGDLMIHGDVVAMVDASRGDGWLCSGNISSANGSASLSFAIPTSATTTALTNLGQVDSKNAGFNTVGGLLRDGVNDSDTDGHPRSVARLEPPSMLTVDPNNNLNRYTTLTRDSGVLFNGRNIGRYGYGSGVYCDSEERGASSSEITREANQGRNSLVQEWLNPYSVNQTGGAWFGPYYRPVATTLLLEPDGFTITRHERSARRYWRLPNGGSANVSAIRYRVRRIGVDTYILNSVQHAAIINNALTNADFTNNGRQFNGVLMFEGDAQVRGVIPTDVQLTVASMGSVYINGSITKGVVDGSGNLLGRPSLSTLMLMAKDFVTVNTTAFFSPAQNETINAKDASALKGTPTPESIIIENSSADYNFEAQFLLNPTTGGGSFAGQPNTWRPYASTYTETNTGTPIVSSLLLQHTADVPGPSFISMNVSPMSFLGGASTQPYLFYAGKDLVTGEQLNPVARTYFTPNATPADLDVLINIPLFGLTDALHQRYTKFETLATPLANSTFTYAGRKINAPGGNAFGLYQLAVQDSTMFGISLNSPNGSATSNYLVSRFAVNPSDVRIEASLFAEEGSFFVIPGPAFNLDASDTRAIFNAQVAALGSLAAAKLDRYDRTGNRAETPFYGEPLNVKVSIIGSVTENMPQPIAVQAAWQRKWNWMPRMLAGTGQMIPIQHVPAGTNIVGAAGAKYVPNLTISLDPALALGSADGVNPIRTDASGRTLPPMPRLPVSGTLSYFGEINP